jgi:hypothetical protein
MERQDTENLFRSYKGRLVNIKTISGGVYEGRVAEVTNDYVCVVDRENSEPSRMFLFFNSLESMMVLEIPAT